MHRIMSARLGLLLAASMACQPAFGQQPDIGDGVRLYASFESSPGPDYAFGSPKLRNVPEAPESVEGRVGRAIRLPDDQKTTALTFAGPGNLYRPRGTIAFWLRPTWDGHEAGADRTSLHFVFSMGGFRVYSDPGGGTVTVMTGTGRPEGWEWNYAPSAPVREWRAGQWHHLAVAWDGIQQHKELFLDGRLAGEADSHWLAYRDSGTDFEFGLAWKAPADYDDLIVWDRMLSPEEIASLAGDPEAAAGQLAALEMPAPVEWPLKVGLHYWSDRLPEAVVAPGDTVALAIPVSNPGQQPVSARLTFDLLDFHLEPLATEQRAVEVAGGAEETIALSFSTDGVGIFKVRCELRSGQFHGIKDVASFGVVPDAGENERDEDSFFGGHPEQTRNYIEQAGRLGLKWARCHDMIQSTRWVRVQPERGNWAFNGDETITRCVANGMHVLGLFFAPPYWAARLPEGLPPETDTRGYPPRDMDEYAEYVRRTVEHYKGRMRYWEVWNEPDVGHFWRGTPEEYVELARVTYQVAKQADPDCVILGGGGVHYSLKEWIERAAAAGMLDHCDWLSYHGYIPVEDPPEAVLDNVNYFKDLLARYGKADMPIVCTEGGVSDTTFYQGLDFEELPPERARLPMSWHRGACRLVQVAAIEMAAGIRKRFYYYHKSPPVARSYLDTSALEITGAPRPKLMAWAAMERQLRGCKYASTVEGQGWQAYLFTGPDRSVAVVWADDGSQARLDVALPGNSHLVDLMGNRLAAGAMDRVDVSEEPLYVVCPGVDAALLQTALGAAR